ncbi:unnamed protein product [Symbiodinium sp. CCMP2592]|nr:unnamed protein product [Symbiodinium sp. CCMP2592]
MAMARAFQSCLVAEGCEDLTRRIETDFREVCSLKYQWQPLTEAANARMSSIFQDLARTEDADSGPGDPNRGRRRGGRQRPVNLSGLMPGVPMRCLVWELYTYFDSQDGPENLGHPAVLVMTHSQQRLSMLIRPVSLLTTFAWSAHGSSSLLDDGLIVDLRHGVGAGHLKLRPEGL